MLSKYFRSTDRIRSIQSGPAGELIEHFAAAFFQRGYGEITGAHQIRAAEHFVRWASRQGISASDLDDKALSRSGRHLDRCHCGRYEGATHREILGAARLFLRHLQGVSDPDIREPQSSLADPDLLNEFREWMRAQRGTHPLTLCNYSIPIRALIPSCNADTRHLDARRLLRNA